MGLALITSTALRLYIYSYTDIHTYICVCIREYIRSIIRTNFFFSLSGGFSMTTAGCTGVTSRAEVAEVAQGCTIRTGAPEAYQVSITVHTSEVWDLHIPSIHRPRHNHPNTFSRRQPRLQHLRYPMSTNATRTRFMGEFAFLLFCFPSLVSSSFYLFSRLEDFYSRYPSFR